MPDYRLSQLAMADLLAIADYTLATWGEEQVYRYLASMEDCFRRLAESPRIGRTCDKLRTGYRRFEHQKHVIFYRLDVEGVFISRILHQNMLPRERLLDDPVS